VHDAVARLARICAHQSPAWSDVSDARNGVHLAIVEAGGSERIACAYGGLAGEMRLFVTALRPHWSLERMAAQHEELLDELETTGPSALRGHLAAGSNPCSPPVVPRRREASLDPSGSMVGWRAMAQTKSTGAPSAKKLESGAKATTAEQTSAEPKPAGRRISRRKAVEQHVRSYFDALGRRDSRAMAEHWSEEGVADIVPLGVLRGRKEIIGLFRDLFAALPELETTVTRIVAGEHEAAVEWRMSGRFTGQAFQGVQPTGTRVEWRGIDLIEVADGKNTSVTAYYDGMSFARQIGLMPALGSGPERAMKGAFNAATRLRRAVVARRSGR
jgi:steroid delta-isomerase-like uncharacterized protein